MAAAGKKAREANAKITKLEESLDATIADWKVVKARLTGIEAALKEHGLFALEHVDGSFSLEEM